MKSDGEIKRHITDYLLRNVTNQKSFYSDLGIFQINCSNSRQLIEHFQPLNNEQIILENKTGANWFVISTQRVISYYNSILQVFHLKEIDDFTEDSLENIEFFIEVPKLEKLVLKTNLNETVVLEAKAGIQCLITLNCIQRLLKFHINT